MQKDKFGKFAKILLKFLKKTLKILKKLKIKAFLVGLLAIILIPFKKLISFFSSSWRILAVIIPFLLFLYYPVGSLLVNNTGKQIDAEIKAGSLMESNTLNMMAFIIDDEVNQKIWTPNLPFFFPSYFLDNMPNFQLGIISSLGSFSSSFAELSGHRTTMQNDSLKEISKLLNYSPTIWLFDPDSTLSTAPSANSQYRQARKLLINYNKSLIADTSAFSKNQPDLIYLLKKTNQDLNANVHTLEKYIREESPYYFGTKSDDKFFYHQGKIYAYYMLLKALSYDYKDIIVANNLYPAWIHMLKSLEAGSRLSPVIVRNGELGSITAPNHLAYLTLYTLSAQKTLLAIVSTLEEKNVVYAD